MSTSTKIILTIAVTLVVVGQLIALGGLFMIKFDFSKLATQKAQENTYEVTEAFTSLLIDTDTDNILISPSADSTCRVVCWEYEKRTHTVGVENGVLTVRVQDTRRWYEHIGIFVGKQMITVYLPAAVYGSLTVSTETGNIELPTDFSFASIALSATTGSILCKASAADNITLITSTGRITASGATATGLNAASTTGNIRLESITLSGALSAKASTGKVELSGIRADQITTQTTTGNTSLTAAVAQDTLQATCSTGNVTLQGSDAATVKIKTTTGNVKGSLLSEKIFFTQTSTGKVEVPRTTGGGTCEIQTSTGNIQILLASAQ